MIDQKLREYADVLTSLYGNGLYLQHFLAVTLTYEEQRYMMQVIAGQRPQFLDDRDVRMREDSARKAKSRLLEKLDGLVLAFQPSSTARKSIDSTRKVFSLVAAAGIAYRSQAHQLAKHKLQLAIRNIVLPDLYDVKLYALRLLRTIAASEPNTLDFKRYSKELEDAQKTHDMLNAIDTVLRKLILSNVKKNLRQQHKVRIANEAANILSRINVKETEPIVVTAGLSLAVTTSQILHDYELATTWLAAYPDACKELGIWDDSHHSSWILQNIIIHQFFGKRTRVAAATKKLLQLSRVGTSNWFLVTHQLMGRLLYSADYKLAAQIATDVVTHERFRKQRADIQRVILQSAGYVAALSGNQLLLKTVLRRRKQRGLSIVHSGVVDIIRALQQDDVLNSLQAFERLIIVLKSGADDAGAEPLKKLVHKMHRQLTAIERRTDVRTQKRLFAEFREEIQRTLLPEALKRL
jgi:hypothetical protein